jgi:hypothetical protein
MLATCLPPALLFRFWRSHPGVGASRRRIRPWWSTPFTTRLRRPEPCTGWLIRCNHTLPIPNSPHPHRRDPGRTTNRYDQEPRETSKSPLRPRFADQNGIFSCQGIRKGYFVARPFGPRAEYHRRFCDVNPLTGRSIPQMGDPAAGHWSRQGEKRGAAGARVPDSRFASQWVAACEFAHLRTRNHLLGTRLSATPSLLQPGAPDGTLALCAATRCVNPRPAAGTARR